MNFTRFFIGRWRDNQWLFSLLFSSQLSLFTKFINDFENFFLAFDVKFWNRIWFLGFTVSGRHDEFSWTVKSSLLIYFLKDIDLNLHWTFSNIWHISWKLAIKLGPYWVVKFNLINTCCNTVKVQFFSTFRFIIILANTISVSHIGCNVIHQL